MNIADLLKSADSGPSVTEGISIIKPHSDDTSPRLSDPLSNLRRRAQTALFDRLGNRLFDPNLGEDQLRAYVLQELDEILADEAAQLEPNERLGLVD